MYALYIQAIIHSHYNHPVVVLWYDKCSHRCPIGGSVPGALPPLPANIHTRWCGLRVLLKDATTGTDGMGFEPSTLHLLDNLPPRPEPQSPQMSTSQHDRVIDCPSAGGPSPGCRIWLIVSLVKLCRLLFFIFYCFCHVYRRSWQHYQ